MSDTSMQITDPRQVTPEWLTGVLRQSGALPGGGRVTQVHVTAESSYTSTVAHLTLTCSHDTPPSAPLRLFLKLSRPDSQQRVVGSPQRRREVEFHNRIAACMPNPPVVRCFQAVYYEDTGASQLLFDDVSATHYAGVSAQPPDAASCASAIDAFAAFHAFWWDHPALKDIDRLPTMESVAQDIAGIRQHFPGFADFAGDRLTSQQRSLYDRALASLPDLMGRLTQGTHLTLIHGDANLSNLMLPRDAAGQAYIIDWQLWGISFCAEDLANLMALFWSAGDRSVLERALLLRYHQGLLRYGVECYDWAALWHDYRLAVIVRILFMPMWFWVSGSPLSLVWSSLERALQAFTDLKCEELLTR